MENSVCLVFYLQVMERCGNEEKLRPALKPIQEVFKCCGATENTRHFFIDAGLCPGDLAKKVGSNS